MDFKHKLIEYCKPLGMQFKDVIDDDRFTIEIIEISGLKLIELILFCGKHGYAVWFNGNMCTIHTNATFIAQLPVQMDKIFGEFWS